MDAMIEWFRNHGWAGWLVLAAGLAVAEMLTLDFTLLMLATGALAAAGVWFIAPGLLWLQILAALAVSVLTLWLLRPSLLEKIRKSPGYRSSLDQIVGSPGLATQEITAHGGEVRVDGQLWEARPYDPSVRILEGHSVEVYGLDGVTLLVHPASPNQIPRRH